MSEQSIGRKWTLVRKTSIARNLRHLLLILMHYQNKNQSAWCKRETLADELGVKVDVVSQQMKELEAIGVVERVWKSRNNRPSREYTIRFSELAKHQRTLRDSSDCTLSESSDCDIPTLSESSRSPLANPQGHSEESLRHEVTTEVTTEVTNEITNGRSASSSSNSLKKKRKAAPKENIPPSVQDVQGYCQERGNGIDPQHFVDHYETNGWMRGKTKIKSWKACVRTWEGNRKDDTASTDAKAEFDKLQKMAPVWPDDKIDVQSAVSIPAIRAAIAIDWKFTPTTFTTFALKHREAS